MQLIDAIDMVLSEHARSVALYGHWNDYTTEQMMSVIIHELMHEAGDAEQRGDIDGEHGVIRELSQVASCCIKAMIVLSDRQDLLAQASRPAGAHSCRAGHVLPASLAHLDIKETAVNSPIEGDRL